ncbi:potassium-transporting ATPase subunit KdpC [Streptomyces sp. HNM0574]|uniref:potassium-transporting ATPase subunit KdpC n=1 Tax=Streptomyces sp. HNM0574 TaxID=2714954 RepID=UPI00146C981D|nr:potassium-transporting ATPase subunit KdpC [Streptomyces sp. HNM0574]NLU68327.1 potassium-transporting ATPase subunit KdpC [Streptomyces sp. HNM0574]
MNTSLTRTLRLTGAAFRALLALTVLTGVLYPLAVTGLAQGLFPDKANGSMVTSGGREVGSELIGQSYTLKGSGKPDPKWFQGRPSHSGYDPLATGSSQLGADDPRLVTSVRQARKQVAEFNGVPEADVPKDAVTGSASAIDPHISVPYARLQAARVAEANNLPTEQVRSLIRTHTEDRELGILGNPRVNVLKLNVALKKVAADAS